MRGSGALMLVGGSGSGKSSLARAIGAEIAADSRVLRVDGDSVGVLTSSVIAGAVELMKPDLLILDDVQSMMGTPGLMSLLEVMRDGFTVLTYMDTEPRKPGRGTLHFAGMRPGRIDEIVYVETLDDIGRRDVLDYYFGRSCPLDTADMIALVSLTEGLSGAYLMELVRRIQLFGVDDWRSEVESVLRAAPALPVEKTEDE